MNKILNPGCSNGGAVSGQCSAGPENIVARIWIKKPSRYLLKKYGWFGAHKIEMERSIKKGLWQKNTKG